MEKESSIFDLQARIGFTRHMGGFGASEELGQLCRLEDAKLILDVGCGVGVTPCQLVKRYGCRVVGVDASPGMIDQATERARREGVLNNVEFLAADACELPFPDGTFDAVLSESVTVFIADKEKAVREYARVAKGGGRIGLNEPTWITPPPPAYDNFVEKVLSDFAQVLTPDKWGSLLQDADLMMVATRIHRVNPRQELRQVILRYGLGEVIRSSWSQMLLFMTSPASRRYLLATKSVPRMFAYLGYGLYVGEKPAVKSFLHQ